MTVDNSADRSPDLFPATPDDTPSLARRLSGRTKQPFPAPDFSTLDRPLLIVTVDTEEDFDWSAPFSADSISVRSMERQELGQRVMERYGIKPIYLCDYPIADQEPAYSILREWRVNGRCEIGTQLHPWVNPPHREVVNERNSYPCNLPLELAREKLKLLTDRIEETIGGRNIVYKAGRSGASSEIAELLMPLGYKVDMSFNPTRDYRPQSGPDHTSYPHAPFWLDAGRDLLSIPLTANVLGPLRHHWLKASGLLWSARSEQLHLPGALSRLGLVNRVTLTPEGVSLKEAKQLTRAMLRDGYRVFCLCYHSPSLLPGSTPYVRTAADLDRFIGWLDGYFHFFRGELGGIGTTPTELYERARKAPLATRSPVRAGVTTVRPAVAPAARGAEIAIFDFLSHETMHHAFNEGYLRTLSAAYPDDQITFHAVAGHIERLGPRVADLKNVAFSSCEPFEVPFGLSRHNPIGGYLAARRCLQALERTIAGRAVRLVTVLGVDANLYGVFGQGWPQVSKAPLHMVLHGQLGETMVWRSRNPFLRAGDFITKLARPLPPGVRFVALELGIKEAIAEISSVLAPSIETLEHPVLVSEWVGAPAPVEGNKVRIAFLGHARRTKGFHIFAELAKTSQRPDVEFHAIGLAAPETNDIDMSGLVRRPSPQPLSRKDYLDALEGIDLVCSPLHSRAYDFTASGTVSDAISALKPLLALRNRSLNAMILRYGQLGYLVESERELFDFVQNFDPEDFRRRRTEWVANLERMREARRPELLGKTYAATVERSTQTRAAAE